MNGHTRSPLTLFLIAGLGLFLAASAWNRFLRDQSSRSVEICVNWEDTQDLVHNTPFNAAAPEATLEGVLERCRAIGAASVAIKEDSLALVAKEGRAILFAGEDIEKFRALGIATDEVVRKNLLWVRKDVGLSRRIFDSAGGAASVRQRKVGDYTVLEHKIHPWDKLQKLTIGFDPATVEILERQGFCAVHWTEETLDGAGPENLTVSSRPALSAWMVTGVPPDSSRIRFYQSVAVSSAVNAASANIVLFENQTFSYGKLLAQTSGRPDRLLRAHTIPPEELKTMARAVAASRFVRAARERSCRFLYFRWNSSWTVEENLGLLRDVAQSLKDAGFRLEPVSTDRPNIALPFRGARLLFAFGVTLLGALSAARYLGLRLSVKQTGVSSALKVWGGAVLISVASGLLVQALLPDTVFVNGSDVFRGVKLSLALPIALAGFILLEPADLLSLSRRTVTLSELAALALVAIAAQMMLERSGNLASAPHPLELTARTWLESILGVRPRFKEFLIGHPLLVAGLYFCRSSERPGLWSRMAVWAGMVALVSIINSFCHLHTPLDVTLLRTFHGLWLGAALGAFLVFAIETVRRQVMAEGSE